MSASVLVTCEHASAEVPPELDDLGLARDVLESHVSFDRGASRIARALASSLGAPLHLGVWSRLVVDLNRREDNPAVILGHTYGIDVPGNAGLDAAAREARIAAYHRPWRESARHDAHQLAAEGGCLHLSIHSFEPALDPVARAFDVGVLYDPDREPEGAIARAVVGGLTDAGLDARENDPYAGTPEGLTSFLRAELPADRYVGLEIEAQRDRFADDPSRDQLARTLADVVERVLASAF